MRIAMIAGLWALPMAGLAQEAGVTSLMNPSVRFTRSEKPYAVLKRGPVEAVVVDNSAVDDEVLPGHRAGYSGLALLRHEKRRENLFVAAYSGLNFEHILDGRAQTDRKVLFEPRNHPMELRLVDAHTVELYQPPTFHHGLESCQRYHLLADGTIELTIEIVAREPSFRNGYIGLFWASYIHQPESLNIHFRGITEKRNEEHWVRGVTPAHGVESTHLAVRDQRRFPHDAPFPLTLVHNFSRNRFTEPWYFGVSRAMAFVQMFREQDGVRITQSPSGGGAGNPAWDFQFHVPDYEVGRLYRFVMRAAYLPYESPEQVERATRTHRDALRGAREKTGGGQGSAAGRP
jgi:hypothetical protein